MASHAKENCESVAKHGNINERSPRQSFCIWKIEPGYGWEDDIQMVHMVPCKVTEYITCTMNQNISEKEKVHHLRQ